MRYRNLAVGVAWLLLAAPGWAQGDTAQADELTVRAAGLATDGPGLLEFFRLRTRADAPGERLTLLVRDLGAKDPSARAASVRELVALGPVAIPSLRQAVKDPDEAEAARAARRCLNVLENQSGPLTAAAVRLLAVRNPPGAAEVLLDFLPASEDEGVLSEVQLALAAVGFRGGKPDPALLHGLEDGRALCRAAAVEALARHGVRAAHPTFRKLLRDPTPSVRLRAGLALARADDPEAVSTLIGLLAELRTDQVRPVEEFLYALAGEQAPQTFPGAEAEARRKYRDAWAAWWRASEGKALLDEIRQHTLTDEKREKGLALIRKLGDDSFEVRQQATAELKALGSPVLPLLQQAAGSPDLEVSQRVQALLQEIEKGKIGPLSATTVRLVALRKPTGSAEALLAYLPMAEDEGLRDEVQGALNAVAHAGGKLNPAVARALEDKATVRRGAAAEAVSQELTPETQAAVRKLLKDPDLGVRLQTALALAGAREREAVPILIALVSELPAERASRAEEYLGHLARGQGPGDLPPGDGAEARAKRRQAWESWWGREGARVELVPARAVSLREPYRGYTLLVQSQNGMVEELGADGKPRWQLTGLQNPQDAQVLPGERVLVAEFAARVVTERNLKGEILWRKDVPGNPIAVQRLPTGHTLIVSRNQLLEVDRQGREVFNLGRPQNDLMGARKMADGTFLCVSGQGTCVRLDTSGKEMKAFRLQAVSNNGNDFLPLGGVLVPITWQNKVYEYDPDGKVVWEATVQQPISAQRLPTGHTLIASAQWPPKVIELDKTGKSVSEITVAHYVHRATRR